jgi:hypothetical protein
MLEEINLNSNLNINLNTYLRLSGACSGFIRHRKIATGSNDTCLDLRDFFRTFKKGSRSVRTIIVNRKNTVIGDLQSVKTFLRITGLNVAENTKLTELYSFWSFSNLNNRLRDFSFKFVNNLLGINTRISHFVGNATRSCSFCNLTKPDPPDETFLHLFYQCETVASTRNKFFEKFFLDFNGDAFDKREIWFGIVPSTVRDKLLFLVTVFLFQHAIWEAKLKKKLPSYQIIEKNTMFEMITMLKLNPTLCTGDINFNLSRNWPQFVQHGYH